ncbi:C2 domain-containing protein [Heterostelium album PN500]|uniref:C2 domain-containing protein n=1 Tax=Heterostelium pallidum (strain ATCC 26659 / Pp 5 / PN500) TaxID=670386 RepID=D3BD09_HETP5|nr:C2 domain-containing protein [Heterostelium album PN500]EFA80801.1 C2 domain-containing protein [Heterostelium album PN500]|eukprot:XP_020432920.1 C2 domain-containing protein [Heterostelium album PN500]
MTSMRGLSKKGDLEITLLDTKGIKSGDIFCIIDLPPNKPFKTHLFKGPDPTFNEKFTLDLMTLNDEEITIVVKEQKPAGSKFLGQIQIPIKALSITPTPQAYFLTDRPLKAGKTPKVVTGSIQIQLGFVHRYQKKTKKIPSPEMKSTSPVQSVPPSSSSSSISDNRSTYSSSDSLNSTDSISSMLEAGGSLSSRSTTDDIEYSREEAVIIDETLKDKESIVMKQLTQQKNFIKQYGETIRKREREGDKTIAGDKIKIQQMQKELDEMEKLVTQSTPSLQQMTNSLLSDIEGLSRSTSKSTMRVATVKSVRAPATLSSPASKVDISTFSFDAAENEKKIREGLNQQIKQLQRENERLENSLHQEKQLSKQASDLTLKLKVLEAENISLVQEKSVLVGRASMFEKEVEKLEKEIEYEHGLKKKESSRKEVERDEVRRLSKELEQSENRNKLLQGELENQKELNKLVKDKPTPTLSQSTGSSDKDSDALRYKIKMLELELDAEKKSREFDVKRVKHYEQELEKSGKMVIRLEAEMEKQDLELASLKRSIERKDRDNVEERLNEVIRILTVLAGKPDGAALSSLAANSDNTVLGRKLKELTEKAQQQTIKSKEMEVELESVRQQKIQAMIQKQRDMSEEEYFEYYEEERSNIGGGAGRSGMLQANHSDQISVLVNKLEKLDKLEDLMRKLDNMKSMVPAGQDLAVSGRRTHAAIKAELQSIQTIIMNEKTPDKDREEANIRFEKVYQELSQTEEHKRELLQIQEDKRKVNDPLNQKALAKLQPTYAAANIERTPELKDRVKAYPELLLIGLDSKIIASKHQNDFQSYFLTNCTLEELRAIRASLPKWRADQKKQMEWTISLENKIEQYSKNPPPQRPVPKIEKPKLKPSLVKPISSNNNAGGQDSVMAELLKRRRKID